MKDSLVDALIPSLNIRTASSLFIGELCSSEKVVLACSLMKRLNKNLLWVCRDSERQSAIMAQAKSFCDRLFYLPSQDALPNERESLNLDIYGYYLKVLYEIAQKQNKGMLVADLAACSLAIPKLTELKKSTLRIQKDQEWEPKQLSCKLESLGYQASGTVEQKGQYCQRRDIIDFFDPTSFEPTRISFWGDQIEHIHTFNPQNQRSLESLEEFSIHHADLNLLRGESARSIFEELDDSWLIIIDEPDEIESQWVDIDDAIKLSTLSQKNWIECHRALNTLKKRPIVFFSTHPLYKLCQEEDNFSTDSFEWLLHRFNISHLQKPSIPLHMRYLSTSHDQVSWEKQIETALQEGMRITFFYSTKTEKKLIEKLSFLHAYEKQIQFQYGHLYHSLCFENAQLIFASISEYHGQRHLWRPTLRKSHTVVEDHHQEWSPGDYVVHLKHGIGIYRGIELKVDGQGKKQEFIQIEYAQKAYAWVPLEQAHLMYSYSSFEDYRPQVHEIGSQKWKRQLAQTQKSIEGYAKQLLEIYAQRQVHQGFICQKDGEDIIAFEEDFPYILSEDQAQAIETIKLDLMNPKPMDRLLCGDVGFGKTEVAMRAALKTVCDGYHQVAILAPTTVLALQHYETLSSRMKDFPVRLALLTRLQKRANKTLTLKALHEGQIDIVIGTHRILSEDVKFKRLGLLIIDEEQRFGVKAKEKLKSYKKTVNCLSLSATPIPRTLYMSLMGAKELSHISTPPQDRLPIATIVTNYNDSVICNALRREMARGGQAFFVHNNIDELYTFQSKFKNLLPQLRLAVVHGQMSPDAIEDIFHAFKEHRIDLLLATTIIETGIDIPNANTIFIYRADCYGLSDLHQLRGRVGRWNRQAFAYFLKSPNSRLSELSQKRLQAIEQTAQLGGGMQVAMRDLQIRGCGNLLGQEQSGHICQIGFNYYCRLLKQTVQKMQKKDSSEMQYVALNWPYQAELGTEYLPSNSQRVDFYRRLGQIDEENDLIEIFDEMVDRFGRLGRLEQSLYAKHLLQLKLTTYPIAALDIQLKKDGCQVTCLWRSTKKEPLIFMLQENTPLELVRAIISSIKQHQITSAQKTPHIHKTLQKKLVANLQNQLQYTQKKNT